MATKKKAASKTGSRKAKESPRARAKVGKVMHEFKHGELKSGGKRKVKNPKQAIAIALSEARRSGENVPPPKKKAAKKSAAGKSASSKGGTAKKTAAKNTAAKNTAAKKSTASKTTAKKSTASKARKKSSSSRK